MNVQQDEAASDDWRARACEQEATGDVLRPLEPQDRIERQYRLFQQAPGFIATMVGPEHRFEFVNDAHDRIFGHRQAVGRTVREVFPELVDQGIVELLDTVAATGERYVARRQRLTFRSPTGEDQVRWLDFVLAPIVGPDGKVEGIFSEGHDVTEAHLAQVHLAERDEQLRLATEAADIGLWDVNVVKDTMYWPARVKAMFGISPDVPVSMADYYAGLHPEDRDATVAAFAAACDPAQRALYDVEYRTIGKEDGVVRHVAARGRGLFDVDGRCVRVIGTAIDITARKAKDAALKWSEEELRESGRRKDQFIATLAHELRNPLAALSTALQLQARRGEATKYTEMMTRQTGHLVRLVDDLMEVARITSGSFELRSEVVSVADVVRHAVETSSPHVNERRHQLSMHGLQEMLWTSGDSVRLAQIVSNLLNNAARFTPPGGRIDITVEGTKTECIVSIADSGPGFTADRTRRMFEMFNRGADSAGLGIGLALSRRLAEMHRGTLEAESPGPGQGATFRLRLPRVPAPPALEASNARVETGVSVSVLIADDNRDAADTIAELLQLAGARVRVAYEGQSALALCAESMPQLLLLDVGMPVMDGYEVARRVRAMPGGGDVTISGLTGWGALADVHRGKEAGFDRHLVKPVQVEALEKLLAEVTARAPAP